MKFKQIILVVLSVLVTLPTYAEGVCRVSISQDIYSDSLSVDAKNRIKSAVIASFSKPRKHFELVKDEDADYLIELTSLDNTDYHHANIINAIAHLGLSHAKNKEMFSYSMHFGRFNRRGNREKAYSEENFERAMLKAIRRMGDCENLKEIAAGNTRIRQ